MPHWLLPHNSNKFQYSGYADYNVAVLAEFMAKVCCWLLLWNFKKKSSSDFLDCVVMLDITI